MSVVSAESFRLMVVISHHVGEKRDVIAKRLGEWLPDPLHGLVRHSYITFLDVNPGEKPCVKAHLCEKAWISIRVAKRI